MNREIHSLAIAALKPRMNNPRTHSKKQLKQIADSIREFGFVNPVLIDGDGGIIAGHGRVEAATLLGVTEVPALRIELQELEVNLGFDVTLTGFDTPELDRLFISGEVDQADEFEAPDHSKPAVSRVGDLWLIGPHRVLCADATKPESYARLLGGQRAQMDFTDPPYNVPIKGHVSGLGKVRHKEFEMASGEMSRPQFTQFLRTIFTNLANHSTDGSVHYICMDWRHIGEVLEAAEGVYSELLNLCVWAKTNGGMGSFYRSQHELVFVYHSGRGGHVNNVELGKHGRNRTNVWSYAGVNTFSANRDKDLAMHPTVKPVALAADAIKDASKRNAIVLDAFGGSGTTLVAAEQTGRRGYALEISPTYVDTIVKRVSEATGKQATLEHTGDTFEGVRAWRGSGLDEEVLA